jgi:hypothetical protein
MSNNVVLFGTNPSNNERYALQCDATGVLATAASVTIASNVDTKTILYSDLTAGAQKKVAIETLGVAPNQKDYLGTSDYAINQSFDGTNSRIKVITEGVRGLSDTAPNAITAVNVKPFTNKNALYVVDDGLNTKINADSSISTAIQVAVKNVVPISGSDYATPTPTYNPLFVDANGFITSNVITTTHENIRLGYDYYKSMLTFLSNANSVFNVPSSATNSFIPALNNDGWLFRNTTPTNPTTGSLMWYNNGPYGPTYPFSTQTDILISQLSVFYVIIQNYYPASQSNIQMNVYTKTTGAIDDYSVDFRSKFNYILDLSPAQYLATGQSYILYHGQVNRLKSTHPDVPRIKYDDNIPGRLGPCGITETVSHIELLFTDLVGGTKFLCNVVEGGLFSTGGHLVNYYFDNDIRTKTDTVISQLTFDNNSLQTTISSDGTNNAEVVRNTTTPVVNLKDTYGLVTDSVLYAKNGSGDIKNLSIDASGNLNVNLASGTISIGSVNIKDSSGNNLGAVSNTIPQLKTTLYDNLGNNILSTLEGGGRALNCHITNIGSGSKIPVDIISSADLRTALVDTSSNSITADSFTFNGSVKNGIDVAVINNAANPVNTSVTNTVTTKLSQAGTDNSVKITNPAGTFTADVTGMNGTFSGLRGLTTTSQVCGYDTSTGTNYPIAAQLFSGLYSLRTCDFYTPNIDANTTTINTKTTSIDTKTVQQYNTTSNKIPGYTANNVGLSTYQILPKVRSFAMSGYNGDATVAADTILGGYATTLNLYTAGFSLGLQNPRTYYLISTAAGRIIKYIYVDASGAEQSGTITLTNANTYYALPSAISINEFKYGGTNTQSLSGNNLFLTTSNTASNTLYVGGINQQRTQSNGIFTCPNNAIAMITNIDAYCGTTFDYYYMNIYDASGNRSMVGQYNIWNNTVSNVRASGGGDYSCLGRILTAGESVVFSTSSATSQYKYIAYNVLVRYF